MHAIIVLVEDKKETCGPIIMKHKPHFNINISGIYNEKDLTTAKLALDKAFALLKQENTARSIEDLTNAVIEKVNETIRSGIKVG